MIQALKQLINSLERLQGRACLQELVSLLQTHEVACDDVADFLRFSDKGYTRNLIRSGPWFNLLALCWKNGQRSPIHDHIGSSCGVRVLRGMATETMFDFAPNGLIKATCSRELPAGSVCASQDADIHQISNLQPGTLDLVTLHIYSPPLLWMGTYSLTDRTRGQEPMFVEFSDAAGI
jgi:cysteine dioxygenase